MDVKDKIVNELLKLKNSKHQSGRTEVVTHCPFCQDYDKTPKFYIEVANENVMRVHCFHGNCGYSGVLTPEILMKFNIINDEFNTYLNSLNKKGISKIRSNTTGPISVTIPNRPKDIDMSKIEYASNRTGIDFSQPDIIKSHKMIYNLKQFLAVNKLDLGLNERYLNDLSDNWVGFLSHNNNILNMRNVSSNSQARYTNLKIDKNNNQSFLYLPPQDIDLLTSVPMIVMAEGAYDIMCIKNRFYPKDTNNVIFGAVGSSASYNRGLMKLIQTTCFFDAEVFIYGDQDITLDFYNKKFAKFLKNNKFTLIRNKKNKDFGNINETVSLDIKKLN
ncbi:MAG: hypothetical protein ACRC5M_04865 [Anaeroplasmataceae bacterium]